jgi:hypothetical protein
VIDRERNALDLARAKARIVNRAVNNPEYFVLLTDAISCFRGQTPVVGRKADHTEVFGKETNKWETRIIGVEATCGPVDTIFFYTIDDMQKGGANVMVSALI